MNLAFENLKGSHVRKFLGICKVDYEILLHSKAETRDLIG